METEVELPSLTQFSHSVKISQSAKGARIDVHVSSNSGESAMREAIFLYQRTKLELKTLGEIVAPIEVSSKNGKEFA